MANELEKLLISLEADTRKMRLALAQSESGVQSFEKAADKSLGRTERRFEQMSANVAGKLKTLGAAMAGLFAVQKIRQDLVDVTALERIAERVGMTTTGLQRLAVVASSAGVGLDQLQDALKDLNMKMGEFRAGQGGFYDYMKRHLPTVHAQLMATKSTAEAFDVVADAASRFATTHERAAFISQALGETGTLLTSTLIKGSAAIRKAGDEAERFGQVLSKEAIKNTAELNNELESLTTTLSTKFKEGLGAAAPYLTSFLKALRDPTASSPANWLATKLLDKQEARARGEASGVAWNEGFAAAAKRMADSGATIKAPLKLQVHIPDFSTEIDYSAADAMNELRVKTTEAMGDAFGVISLEYERDLERFRRLLSEKKISEEDYHKAREQLSIQAGTKIKAAYEEETKAVRELGEAFSDAMQGAFGDSFSQLLETGKLNFRQFTASLLADIAKVYVQSQVLKPAAGLIGSALSGALSGLGGVSGSFMGAGGWATSFAGAFGGFRANGGPVSAGKSYMVGERGPELFTPRTSGAITPNGASGGNVYNIDARGAEIGVEERVRSILMEVERERQSPVAAVTQYQRRFPTRRAA